MSKLYSVIIVGLLLVFIGTLKAQTKEQDHIGMPVGGIGSGQIYLGGDGQFWYWDILNIQRINSGAPGEKFYIIQWSSTNNSTKDSPFALRTKLHLL